MCETVSVYLQWLVQAVKSEEEEEEEDPSGDWTPTDSKTLSEMFCTDAHPQHPRAWQALFLYLP